MKVIAVIVTYNRLQLLKKCLTAVSGQSTIPDEIIVVNNGSTDNTQEWLSGQPVTTYNQENMGGAGGFSFGIKEAYAHNADWIWVMDDDTIPARTALEKLLDRLAALGPRQNEVGFLCSNVRWTDDSTHEMNRTYLLTDKTKLAMLPLADNVDLPFVQFGTFVSMLISARAVEKVGLPIKEYFIWNDDVEYSKRMIRSGFAGLAVEDSVALHETPINHISSVFKDTHAHLWKYRHGMRNELFTKLSHEGNLSFWTTWVHRMFIMPFRIAINRKDHRWPFVKLIWKTSIEAMFFRPVIEYAKKPAQSIQGSGA